MVCLYSLSVVIMSLAKTAEPIEIPFGLWTSTRVGPEGPDPHMGMGNFEGGEGPIVKYIEYRPCAAAMRPFVKLL